MVQRIPFFAARKDKMPAKRYRDLEGEEWKLVAGTEDIYVSNLGRVRKNDKLKKIYVDPEGYCHVHIGNLKKRLHRVVAEAFVPNPHGYPVIDHLDNNKQNCRADNLEWVTQQENTKRAYADGLTIYNSMNARYVLAIDPDKKGILFDSQAACAQGLELEVKSVNKVIRGTQKTTGGYRVLALSDLEDRRTKGNKNGNLSR